MYADPKTKVMSFFTMGFNQHTRGTWCGNPALQPAPAHREDIVARQQPLPAHRAAVGMRHRARSRYLLAPPARGHGRHQPQAPRRGRSGSRSCRPAPIPEKPGLLAVLQNRMLKDGKLNAYWVQRGTRTCRPTPNLLQETYPGYRNPENFIVVSDAYPTVTTMAADLILPHRHVGREGRRLWECGAADPVLAPVGGCTRASRNRTCGSSWNSPSASRWRRCGPPELLDARSQEYRGKTMFDVLFRNGKVDAYPTSQIETGLRKP